MTSENAKKDLLQILNSKIDIYAVTKNQNIICNKIPLRNTYFNKLEQDENSKS